MMPVIPSMFFAKTTCQWLLMASGLYDEPCFTDIPCDMCTSNLQYSDIFTQTLTIRNITNVHYNVVNFILFSFYPTIPETRLHAFQTGNSVTLQSLFTRDSML